MITANEFHPSQNTKIELKATPDETAGKDYEYRDDSSIASLGVSSIDNKSDRSREFDRKERK